MQYVYAAGQPLQYYDFAVQPVQYVYAAGQPLQWDDVAEQPVQYVYAARQPLRCDDVAERAPAAARGASGEKALANQSFNT